MSIKITNYNAICNLGVGIEEVFNKALAGNVSCFEMSDEFINGKNVFVGKVNTNLPQIDEDDFNTRANKILLKTLEPLKIEQYNPETLGVVCATTNTGVEDFEKTGNLKHAQIGNPAEFIYKHFGLKNYYTSVSTACSSGIKAFAIAKELLDSKMAENVLVAGTDALTKLPIYGFDSLEILSDKRSNPFSKNRNGINISEGAAAFIVKKNDMNTESIEILGIGETTDCYHATTPDPEGLEAEKAVRQAIKGVEKVDYINLHGTGTGANDLMEGRAISRVFGKSVPASSTKPMTGHLLGAAACVEIALCCALLENGGNKVFPHIYDGEYDDEIPLIWLADTQTEVKEIKTCLCTSFGFGGTNCAMTLGLKKL